MSMGYFYRRAFGGYTILVQTIFYIFIELIHVCFIYPASKRHIIFFSTISAIHKWTIP